MRMPAFYLALLLVLVSSGCSEELRKPLAVGNGRVTVMNMTDERWSEVSIWLNSYYRAQFPGLDVNGRLDAPLERFEGAFGRRYDPAREQPHGVEVTATTASGKPVKLVWGTGKQ
jgi:hypothetical protein